MNIITNVFESYSVRSVIIDGNPWFIAKDVAEALGYKQADKAVRQRCDEFKILKPGDLAGMKIPNRGLQVINESDVYNLVFGSKLESAQRFRKWVTKEVLPSIRKTGGFIAGISDNHAVDSELRSRITAEFARKAKDLLSDIDRHDRYGALKRREVMSLCDQLSKRHGVPASLIEAMMFNGMKALEGL
ncbi:TPA: Bro-N domain-containing protein [Klebsiella pneumoniae]|mgnify:CR=1 FL=1|uniref:BRO-N domain-containing protein n=1 Tax=Klebsiella pneumoniae TaxID=573 RepID=UPI000E2D5FFD|nr:BRO family protein [Klebsiella pneumoniae]KAB1522849.1 hypothetical protein F8D12_20810 [Klebsiella pneumoniae]KAB1561083.1 hypothetical protein F8D17_13015 [Klebsiella pneumoniae]MCJ3356208.1 hypothetical protein [Klebsiella pneumoniae]MCJ3383846.1 hypothetical protein [Klebsiella pneumoniae]QHP46014.1 hypothetical protein DRA87_04060 [Klebsiella pneumoniae]